MFLMCCRRFYLYSLEYKQAIKVFCYSGGGKMVVENLGCDEYTSNPCLSQEIRQTINNQLDHLVTVEGVWDTNFSPYGYKKMFKKGHNSRTPGLGLTENMKYAVHLLLIGIKGNKFH